MDWIPRSSNEIADHISRIRDFDDWQVNQAIFQQVQNAWGPFTLDCFTSGYNSKLRRFHSKFWVPNTEAVDTFTVNWAGEACWLVPPLHLVGRTLRHAEACKANGALVVPMWKSAAFWPLLCPDGRHLAAFIHAWHSFPFCKEFFLSGRCGDNIAHSLTADSLIWLVMLILLFLVGPIMLVFAYIILMAIVIVVHYFGPFNYGMYLPVYALLLPNLMNVFLIWLIAVTFNSFSIYRVGCLICMCFQLYL